ncbi:MAG: HYR domain-containing protein, partial [Acidobacteria bacterium]|nr:HYR domain-containing protein [Acidobacteriota bacterium]
MHTSQAKEHAQGKAKQAGRLSVLALCLLAGLGCAVWLGQALRGAAANFQMIRVAPDKLLVGTLGTPYQDVLRASGGGSSVYTFTLDNEVRDCLPAGLSLENGTPDDAAAVRGTPQEAGVFTFTVKVSSPPAVPTRQHFTILIRARAACPVLGLVEDVPCNPRLTLGVFYSETFNVAGVGTAPYQFDVDARVGERLPRGMELVPGPRADQVTLRGTPEETGFFTFHIRVEDANGCYGVICHDYPIRNNPECLLNLFPDNLDEVDSIQNEPLALSFTPNNGAAPYAFSFDNRPGESVPPGLLLASNATAERALLSGAPQEAGTFSFTLRAKDKNGCEITQSYTLAVRSKIPANQPPVCPAVTLAPQLLANGTLKLNAPFNQTFTASGGAAPYTFTVEAMPPGLLVNASTNPNEQLALGGAPTQTGSWEFRVKATDKNGCEGNRTYVLNVHDPDCPVILLPRSLPGGVAGETYAAQTIQPQPANRAYNLTISSGALPSGLMLAGNVLQGTPTLAGTFKFTLTAQSGTCSGAREYTVLIGGPFVCPPNLTQTLAAGATEAVVSYPLPTAPPGNTVTCTPAAGSTFKRGATTVTCVSAGAAATMMCSFTVTLTTCTIGCPAAVTATLPAGQCAMAVTYAAPVLEGACGPATCTPASGSSFAAGVKTVTCTAPDGAGGNSACSFTVTVNATQIPPPTCPANITRAADQNQCTAIVNYAPPVVPADCVGTTVSCVPAAGTAFPLGVTTVTCTATDAAQNKSTCAFTVTINDAQAPTLVCPDNLVKAADQNQCATAVTYTNATASDNCAGVGTPVCTPPSGATFTVGQTTVMCSVRDAAQNLATCSFTVTVNDTQAPVITACTPEQRVVANGPATVSYPLPSVTDNCANPTVSCVPASGTSFPPGVRTVTCTATDAGNNTAACSFTVTVTGCGFVPTPPPPVTANAAAGRCDAVVAYATPATNGACGVVTCAPAAGASFPVGITTVNCSTTDANGVTSSTSFTVTVNDTQAPVLTNQCPDDLRVVSATPTTVSYPLPAATDNCGTPTVSCVPASGATFALGLTTVTCTATDAARNASSCTFRVGVTPCPQLSSDPVTVEAAAGQCAAVVSSYPLPADSADCGTVTCVPPAGATFAVGVRTVTCSSTDSRGVPNASSFTVTVKDAQPPRLTCPPNLSVKAATPSAVSYDLPLVTDNCPGVGQPVCEPASGSIFPVGATTVICRARDATNNEGQCSFTVTVAPEPCRLICPAPVSTDAAPDQCTAQINYPPPATEGTCGAVTCTPPSGSSFAVGVTTVTCREASGAVCSFAVTVNDKQAPVIANCALPNLTRANDPNQCQAVVNYALPPVTDNCPGALAVCTPAPGTAFPVGVTTVTCRARDVAGNTSPSTCSFTVTVNDTQAPPPPVCSANVTRGNDPNQCQAVVNYTLPAVTDNCPGAVAVCTPAPGTAFPVGVTTVNCLARDAAGNSSPACSFTVTVNDTQVPVLAQPADLRQSAELNQCQAVVNYAPPAATENCPGTVTVSCTPAPG